MPEPRLSIVDGESRALPRTDWCALFEHRARRFPARTALVADGTAWSFGELDVWSTRLARRLHAAGATPGSVIACAMTRSVRAVVALLAVAKAGAVHLPVDPAQPAARVAAILADARPALLLTDAASLEARADVVLPPGGWQAGLSTLDGTPLARTTATGPAYVVYTSGSTGTPKGVVVGHGSLVNLYRELAARVFPTAARRVAHGLPFSFDASWNPLLWLVGGHEVHLVPDEVRADPERYVRFVREHRVSVVEAVPAHLTALVSAGLLARDTRPELVLTGGEAVSASLWSRLRATPGLSGVNLYGPTECTVFTTSCRLDEREAPAIGRPIGNTRAEVVDARLRPVPVGEPGELLVSGACLAEEYLGRPELTADRFVTARGRAYRTGDRCRLLPDGNLEWLSRVDDQVKIRGHRVEPGETEHVLLAVPGVRQAAVRAEGTGTATRLVAYVVLDRDTGTGDAVREHLRRLLPDYLVPAEVVTLDALPLGPHGKIDRAAITVREPATLTPAQEIVAASFRTLLGIDAVDAHSDFFALGGHSLTAAALANQLRALGVLCSLRDVLRHRTVARLAELLEGTET
jgi:amino acid adenylation domain-containing protein